MLLEYYSVEKRDIIRRQFEFVCNHGELELYCFRTDAKDKNSPRYMHAGLFVRVSQTQAIMARFSNMDITYRKDRIPDTIEVWKRLIKDDIEKGVSLVRPYPPDAWYFGYTDQQINLARENYEKHRKIELEKKKEEIEKEKEQEEKRYVEYIDSLKMKVKNDEQISGSDLVELAKYLKIDIHGRTAGYLKKNVVGVNSYTAKVLGRKSYSQFDIYKQVKESL